MCYDSAFPTFRKTLRDTEATDAENARKRQRLNDDVSVKTVMKDNLQFIKLN